MHSGNEALWVLKVLGDLFDRDKSSIGSPLASFTFQSLLFSRVILSLVAHCPMMSPKILARVVFKLVSALHVVSHFLMEHSVIFSTSPSSVPSSISFGLHCSMSWTCSFSSDSFTHLQCSKWAKLQFRQNLVCCFHVSFGLFVISTGPFFPLLFPPWPLPPNLWPLLPAEPQSRPPLFWLILHVAVIVKTFIFVPFFAWTKMFALFFDKSKCLWHALVKTADSW